MSKIIISQSILWATAILVVSLIESGDDSLVYLGILAIVALGSLKKSLDDKNR